MIQTEEGVQAFADEVVRLAQTYIEAVEEMMAMMERLMTETAPRPEEDGTESVTEEGVSYA